ncbi:MAG TPA: zf-TFIIB domain-containing protein [Verrucomicrobiota bacterium]|nr:zf-TFIIB domain-containing protein [Verrucomicrobiota bacterium]HPU55039.1 zf-TFIIB domain-containing protein [Verrucomicrobiota bacterium]
MNACLRDAGLLNDYLVQTHSVGRCARCSGLWLPGAVVKAMLGRFAVPSATATATTLQCPDDRSQLLAVKYRGVEIDVCSGCGGVWLDRGELERILRQSGKGGVAGGLKGGAGEVVGEVLLQGVGELVGEAASSVLEFIFEALSGF